MMAAVSVVFPWSMWPMVPTFTWGFVRTNFSLAIADSPSAALGLGDDLFGDARRDGLILVEMHAVDCASLRLGAQIRRVAEHIGERDRRVDGLEIVDLLHASDGAAARVEVTDHIAHIFLGRADLDLHDGLEELDASLLGALLEAERAGDLEGGLARVDVMVATIVDLHLDVDDGIAREHAARHRTFDTLADGGDVLARDDAADDRVLEDEAFAKLRGTNLKPAMTVLTAATGLTHIAAFGLHRGLEALAVGDLRRAHVALDLELALQAVDDDLEVELAHSGDDGLTGLFVGMRAEGGILCRKPREGLTELLLVGLRLRLDRDRDDGLGELHALKDDGILFVAEGITRGRRLEANSRGDISGVERLDLFAVIGVHEEEATDALLLALGRVEHGRAALDEAGVAAEEGELPDVGIVHDLERERREGGAIVRRTRHAIFGIVGMDALDGHDIGRARHEVDDRVEERLDALILEGGVAED